MTSSTPTDSNDDRRQVSRGRDRRREAWRAFRHAYPTFLKIAAAIFLIALAFDMWLVARHFAYRSEISRLRQGMTSAERQKSDLIIQSEQNKLRVALELAKRQAQWDPKLHLSVAVDSGRMYLLRDGALLRDMVVRVAPDSGPHSAAPRIPGDTGAALPRGQRTIMSVDGGDMPVLRLNGGTRIYASADTTSQAVTPGDIRANPTDLKAVLPNVSPGMSVYLY